jgi:4-diphosphocytidyl-2-C-methyl-D-erythritol kinase
MITRQCPAKINLFLKIINQRSDGFHNLLSVITKINLYDYLSVEKSDHFSLEIFGQFKNLINPKDNLFTTILNYFQEQYHISNNIKIILEKNIPVGAGLGGGSSDACSFMKILNEIFNLNLTKSELQKISLNFGSDIAFFFEETTQIVMNRGETLCDYNDLEKLEIVLIYPQINLSTKKIFQDFASHNSSHSQPINANKNFLESANSFSKNLTQQQIFDLENDLEKIAVIHAPIIQEIKNNMQNFGSINCKMSGSGSAVFAIYANYSQAQIACDKLQEIYPNFFIKHLQNF